MNYIAHAITTEEEMSDFYCGCGGSSSGAKLIGLPVKVAANHWDLALKTHNANHPDTDHRLVDLLISSPASFPYTALAWFSPECTWHSGARGEKRKNISQLDMFRQVNPDPAAERSRVTMWDVVRFSEFHRYQVVIVENVVEIKDWPPYESWLMAMRSLGYEFKVNYFNSRFFHPLNGQDGIAPQNRDRIFIVFWRKGNKAPDLDFRPLAYCPHCERDVRAVQVFKKSVFPLGYYDTTGGRGQYYYACPNCFTVKNNERIPRRVEPYYFAAASIVNWELPITRIGDRPDPLKPNTLRRIQLGLDKFGQHPLMVQLSHSHAQNNRCSPLGDPWPAQTTRQSLAFVVPFKGEAEYQHMRPSSSNPLPTQTSAGSPALVTVTWLVEMYGSGELRPLTEPVNTVTAGGIKSGVCTVPGFITTYHSRDDASHSLGDPFPTVDTSNRAALVTTASTPFIASYYGDSDMLHSVGEPVYTLTTKDRHSLIMPQVALEDCGFRMLEPDECKRGQGFGREYIVLGNRKEQIKQIGNAVSTTPAAFLIKAGKDSIN